MAEQAVDNTKKRAKGGDTMEEEAADGAVGVVQGSGDAAATGVGDATEPGVTVPEGVTLAGHQALANELLEAASLTTDVAAPLVDGAPVPGAESQSTGEASAITPTAESEGAAVPVQAAEALPVSTSAESTVGGVAATDSGSGGGGDAAGLPDEASANGAAEGAVPAAVTEGAAPAVSDRRIAPADRRQVATPPEGIESERRKTERRELVEIVATAPVVEPKLAADHVHIIPAFLLKSSQGTPPDPVEPLRVGFDQLSPPDDTELLRVWRVSDPTKWWWAKQEDSFLAPTLVWERRAYLLSQNPGITVLTAEELRDLA